MPLIKVQTSLPFPAKADIEAMLLMLSSKLASHLGKPESYVMTAQIQLPDDTQKSLDLTYDTAEKHYTVKLDSKVVGGYKVAILTDIKILKVKK